jgi:hypothetical protein
VRQTIINSLEMMIWAIGGLIAIVSVIGGIMAISAGQMQGLLMIIGGPLYAILFMGMFFIVLGIHTNTKRTAEAIEKLANR